MARTSKLLTKEVIAEAHKGLKLLGNYGAIAVKLKAIIAAEVHGITAVAEFFDTTKATVISWIKKIDESLEQLHVQPGRGRKQILNETEEGIVKRWIQESPQITIKELQIKIEKNLKKTMGRSTVHRLLTRLSFSYITPRPRHYKQDTTLFEESKKKSD